MIKAIEQIPVDHHAVLDKALWGYLVNQLLLNVSWTIAKPEINAAYNPLHGASQALRYTAIAYVLRRKYLVGFTDLLPVEQKIFSALPTAENLRGFEGAIARDEHTDFNIERALYYAESKVRFYTAKGANQWKFPSVALAQAYYNTFSNNT